MTAGTTKAAKAVPGTTGAKAGKPDESDKPDKASRTSRTEKAASSEKAKKPSKAKSVKTASDADEKSAVKKSSASKAPASKASAAKKSSAKTPVKTSAKTKTVAEKASTKKTAASKSSPSKKAAASEAASTPTAAAMAVALPGATLPDFPGTEYSVVEKLLVGFIAAEVRKVGLHRAVLGLSGGIDSAVSAAVAARALGPENVLGVMMPYHASSPESLADAYAVAENLGIETLVVDISAQVDSYFERFGDASQLRRGNKMARERMTILYDHSAARSALVIGTSNKTELLLGYGTLFGDMASALNPIGDLYKTQVWGLARHLGLPAAVIEKAPTADLWSGQTDETELGFSYYDADKLLYRMIDERCRHDELAEMGFDPVFVERLSRMVRSSQFKRRLPVIAKLSARSIDTDFRYSRDWGL